MEYEKLYRDWREQSLKTWTEMMNPEASVQAVGASTDMFRAGQRKVLEATQTVLDASELPSHKDFARLQHLVGLAESRTEAAEAVLAQAVLRTAALEAEIDAANQMLQASQARLTDLETRLSSLESVPPAPKPRSRKAR